MKYFFSGTFDPFTKFDAALVFDTLKSCKNNKVVIALELDSEKPSFFSVAFRMKMIEASVQWYAKQMFHHLETSQQADEATQQMLENISIVSYHGIPVYEAQKHGAEAFLIPVTNVSDPSYDVKFDLSRQIGEIKLKYSIGLKFSEIKEETENVARKIKLCYKNHEYVMLEHFVAPPVHNMLMGNLLEGEYYRCCKQSGISWPDFCNTMSRRAYHNLSHIAYILDMYALYKASSGKEFDLVEENNFKAAIFFHDYNDMGDYEKSFKASKLSDSAMCLFKAGHCMPVPSDCGLFERLMQNLNLFIICDEHLYAQYAHRIRAEHENMPFNKYVMTRMEILRGLKMVIEENTVFTMIEKEAAVKNIMCEISSLLNGQIYCPEYRG